METGLSRGHTSGSLRSPCNLRGTPNFLPKLKKNQDILPSTEDEALFCCGVSRGIPPSLLSLERVLNLEATHEYPRHTRLHSRGTPRVPTQLMKSPCFPSSSRDEGPFPCFIGKESWHSHPTSRGGGLNLNLQRNARVRATIPKNPNDPIDTRYT